MTITELRAQRAIAVAAAKAITAKDVLTAEDRTAFDNHIANASNLAADITRMEQSAALEAESRSAVAPPRGQPGESADPAENVEVRNKRVRASFRHYLATGQIETRDLTTANSGVAVPQLFDPQIVEAQKSYGQIYNIINLMKTVSGNPMKMVLDNDTGNTLAAVTSGTDAVETDPALTSVTLQVDNFTTGVVKVDMGLLQDAGFDVEAFIRDKFGKRFYRGASNLIMAGDGGAVASLATSFAAGYTSATTGTLAYKDFATAIATLDPAYQDSAVWAVSNATLGYIVGLTDTNSRPLFLPFDGGGTNGFVGTILGKPVKLVTQLPSVATGNAAVMFGDFKSAYTLRQQGDGLNILRLNERYAAGFEVGFVGFCRLGGVATAVAGFPPVISCTIK